jgi:hypothetical protein
MQLLLAEDELVIQTLLYCFPSSRGLSLLHIVMVASE